LRILATLQALSSSQLVVIAGTQSEFSIILRLVLAHLTSKSKL
jgi:hypothetical protein